MPNSARHSVTRPQDSVRISDRSYRLLVLRPRVLARGNNNIIKNSLYALLAFACVSANANSIDLQVPDLALRNVPATVSVTGAEAGMPVVIDAGGNVYRSTADSSGNAEFTNVICQHLLGNKPI